MADHETWMIGEPGGTAGPFYSVVTQRGTIVAMQIPERKRAEDIASIPEMQARIEELEAQAVLLQRNHDSAIVRDLKHHIEDGHHGPLTMVPTGTLEMIIDERTSELKQRIVAIEKECDDLHARLRLSRTFRDCEPI